jgi:predicted KAP-like P-loop ATPase
MRSLGNKALLIGVVFLLPLAFKAQNTIFTEVYNYNTKLAPVKASSGKTISYYNEGMAYFAQNVTAYDTDVLAIGEYNSKTQKTSFLEIKKTKDLKKLFNHGIDAIAVNNNKLIIISYEHIFIFRKNNHELTFQKTLRNDGSF